MNHVGVPESKACEHDEASLRCQHWRTYFWETTKCVVVEVKSSLLHIFPRKRFVEFWTEQDSSSRHTWDQTFCRAPGHANPNDLQLLPRNQNHSKRHANMSQSCVCAPLDHQSLCQQYLGTLRECFQLVSENGSRPPDGCFLSYLVTLLKAFHQTRSRASCRLLTTHT